MNTHITYAILNFIPAYLLEQYLHKKSNPIVPLLTTASFVAAPYILPYVSVNTKNLISADKEWVIVGLVSGAAFKYFDEDDSTLFWHTLLYGSSMALSRYIVEKTLQRNGSALHSKIFNTLKINP